MDIKTAVTGKTIKTASFAWDIVTLDFTDGTSLTVAASDDQSRIHVSTDDANVDEDS